MPLDFQARSSSSYDRVSGITALVSRILPAELADGTQGTEYHYAFYQNGKRIGTLGFLGTDRVFESDGWREHVFFLDLGHDWLVQDLLALKKRTANVDDDLIFIQQFSNGLVLANVGEAYKRENLRYVATTTMAALANSAVVFPAESPASRGGGIVLAEVSIRAHLPGSSHAG